MAVQRMACTHVGHRVRVQGLQAKPEFNGRTGTVKSKVEGGRWCVLLDTDRKELALKPGNFTHLSYTGMDMNVREVSSGPLDDESEIDYLENGAIICRKHRFEVCGACGMDFRPVNSSMGASVPELEPLMMKAKELGAHNDGLQNIDPSMLPAILDSRPRESWGGRGALLQRFNQTF